MVYKGCMVQTLSSQATSLTTDSPTMSSSSNSSLSCPGHLDSQWFRRVFPTALPCHQCNILYATILQQPFLVADLEWQSSYEEDDSIQSLIHVFHHLCSTQIYLGSFELHTDHMMSSTLHMAAALDNILDLLHDHGFHHHVLSLPLNNITLVRIFWPIYHTLTVVERDTYEESDLRLVDCLSSPSPILPVPAPHAPSPTPSLETPASSPLSTTTTLLDTSIDSRPAFHQGGTASYPTRVAPQDPHLGPEPTVTNETRCFHCHITGYFRVDCLEYECPNCHQCTPGHPQYWCLRNYCSFCCWFGHTPCYCLDRLCALCNDPSLIVTDCPFSEDPSSGVIFNDRDPEGLWSCTGGTSLWRGIVMVWRSDLIFSILHLPPLISWSPFTFMVSVMFLSDVYQHIVW